MLVRNGHILNSGLSVKRKISPSQYLTLGLPSCRPVPDRKGFLKNMTPIVPFTAATLGVKSCTRRHIQHFTDSVQHCEASDVSA